MTEPIHVWPRRASRFSGKVGGPSGWVRVSVSLVVAETLVAPSLAGLYERYPKLRVDLTADDRVVDLVRDGIDIALPQRVPIHALILQERHRLPKVRACIDYWVEWLSATSPSRRTPVA